MDHGSSRVFSLHIALCHLNWISAMSIAQDRRAFLVLAIAQIADQHQKLSLEMATIRGMRREVTWFSASLEDGDPADPFNPAPHRRGVRLE